MTTFADEFLGRPPRPEHATKEAVGIDHESLTRRLAITEGQLEALDRSHRDLAKRLADAGRERADLVKALETALKVAKEARIEWDRAPSGMKAGKLLIALHDPSLHYRDDITEMHAALARSKAQGGE